MTEPETNAPVPVRRWEDHGVGRLVRIAHAASSVIATGALILAVILLITLPGDITDSRRSSARDSCKLLLGLANAATPPARRPALDAYIASTPLHDCGSYARKLVR